MTAYEYKVVPAPVKGEKAKGVRGAEERFAFALEQVMNRMGVEGWEYQRAETLPSEERAGLTGSVTTWRNLLVFRRRRVDDLSAFEPRLLDAPDVATPQAALTPRPPRSRIPTRKDHPAPPVPDTPNVVASAVALSGEGVVPRAPVHSRASERPESTSSTSPTPTRQATPKERPTSDLSPGPELSPTPPVSDDVEPRTADRTQVNTLADASPRPTDESVAAQAPRSVEAADQNVTTDANPADPTPAPDIPAPGAPSPAMLAVRAAGTSLGGEAPLPDNGVEDTVLALGGIGAALKARAARLGKTHAETPSDDAKKSADGDVAAE